MLFRSLSNPVPLPYSSARLPTNHSLPPALKTIIEARATKANPKENDLRRSDREAKLEAILMATDEPLQMKRLVSLSGFSGAGEVREGLEQLKAYYDREGSAFQIKEVAGGYQLQTRPEFHTWVARIRRGQTELKLSSAGRETLTIIAYKQPITRADLEAIRGVQSGEVLKQLMEKGIIRIVGRDDTLGRPVLYGTTRKFLQIFGLNSIRDLPMADAMGIDANKSKPLNS